MEPSQQIEAISLWIYLVREDFRDRKKISVAILLAFVLVLVSVCVSVNTPFNRWTGFN